MPNSKDAPWGVTYLGRDEAKWGKDGVGAIPIDPNVCAETGECPYYRDRDFDLDNDKIHLVIASFRDRLCPRTMFNIFRRSKNPHRIFVRVLQQIKPDSDLIDDADCWQTTCDTYNTQKEDHVLQDGRPFDCHEFASQVDMITIDANLAKGPCDARSKLSAALEHDHRHKNDGAHRLEPVDVRDYCMQTDSHMDFSDGFDNSMIAMFHRAENDRAVLSTYVADMTQNNQDPKEVPHLCMITYTATWRNWGTKFIKYAKKPKLTNLVWGAGMSFQKCHAELNVPYDPYLDNVFDGEETSRGIRFFTHGYDVYTPDKVLVTHDYKGHQSNPVIHSWGGRKGASDPASDPKRKELFEQVDWSYMDHVTKMKEVVEPKGVFRINVLMGLKKTDDTELKRKIVEGRYGLGTARSLESAYEYAGFSPADHKMHKNQCGNLKWVPFADLPDFNEKNDWGVAINLQRRIWNETEALVSPPSPPKKAEDPATEDDKPAAGPASGLLAKAGPRLRALKDKLPHNLPQGDSTYVKVSWILVFAFVIGGLIRRQRSFRSKNTAKSL